MTIIIFVIDLKEKEETLIKSFGGGFLLLGLLIFVSVAIFLLLTEIMLAAYIFLITVFLTMVAGAGLYVAKEVINFDFKRRISSEEILICASTASFMIFAGAIFIIDLGNPDNILFSLFFILALFVTAPDLKKWIDKKRESRALTPVRVHKKGPEIQ